MVEFLTPMVLGGIVGGIIGILCCFILYPKKNDYDMCYSIKEDLNLTYEEICGKAPFKLCQTCPYHGGVAVATSKVIPNPHMNEKEDKGNTY